MLYDLCLHLSYVFLNFISWDALDSSRVCFFPIRWSVS